MKQRFNLVLHGIVCSCLYYVQSVHSVHPMCFSLGDVYCMMLGIRLQDIHAVHIWTKHSDPVSGLPRHDAVWCNGAPSAQHL